MSSMEINNSESIQIISSQVVDNDVHVKLQELSNKLIGIEKENEQIKLEKQKMQDSYDVQRGNYKKLFMQKEDEVEKLKNELESVKHNLSAYNENDRKSKETELKAQAEQIAELCQIVHDCSKYSRLKIIIDILEEDTVEESSSSQSQVKNLQKAIQTLEDQLAKLTSEKGDSILLAPTNMLLATKSFAKKVVSQLGPDPDKSADDLEDSMKKAKENADAMRSIVVPLEEQISDLTEKLRISEEKLMKYDDESMKQKSLLDLSGFSSSDSSKENVDGVSPSRSHACEMCANYEAQLQMQQQQTKRIQKQKEIIESNLLKFKEELAKETQFRKEMEEKWNEKKEEQKLQVQQLKAEVIDGKSEMQKISKAFRASARSIEDQLVNLTLYREKVSDELRKLQEENDNLVGKHSKHSEQLRNEPIDFPDKVDELQVLLLKSHEDLIQNCVAKEHLEEQHQIALKEIEAITKQFLYEQSQREEVVNELVSTRSSSKSELKKIETERNKLKASVEKLSMQEIHHKGLIGSLNDKIKEITSKSDDYHAQVLRLQEQLEMNEVTQKDFVVLTQSLQIELEKLRGVDTEVRWQHEDDVNKCEGCKYPFQSSKKKGHCKHCGKIFCPNCLSHSVPSGPQRRPSPVCNVCHTLLVRNSAPFYKDGGGGGTPNTSFFQDVPPNTPAS